MSNVTLNEVKGTIPSMAPFAALRVTAPPDYFFPFLLASARSTIRSMRRR
jgi:hypothetical protein